jgi:hypothetical protein
MGALQNSAQKQRHQLSPKKGLAGVFVCGKI